MPSNFPAQPRAFATMRIRTFGYKRLRSPSPFLSQGEQVSVWNGGEPGSLTPALSHRERVI
jgi:hypothetical protein